MTMLPTPPGFLRRWGRSGVRRVTPSARVVRERHAAHARSSACRPHRRDRGRALERLALHQDAAEGVLGGAARGGPARRGWAGYGVAFGAHAMGERAARAVELLYRSPATPARFDAVPAGAQAVRRASADHDGKRQAQRCAAAPVAGRTQGGVSHPAIRKPAWGALPSPLSAPSLVTSIQSTFNDAGQPGPPHV